MPRPKNAKQQQVLEDAQIARHRWPAYARQPFHERDRWNAEQVHDYVLFLANTGLRPDEANNLQHRDVAIVEDDATGETILEIEVRGKRGIGFCKSMPSAVRPYERLLGRAAFDIEDE